LYGCLFRRITASFFPEPSCGVVRIPGVVEQQPDANISGVVYQQQPKQPQLSEERNASRTNEESEVTPSTKKAERSGKRKLQSGSTSGQLQGTVVSV